MSPKIRSAAAAVTLASVVSLAPKANGSDPHGAAAVSDRVVEETTIQVIDATSFGSKAASSSSSLKTLPQGRKVFLSGREADAGWGERKKDPGRRFEKPKVDAKSAGLAWVTSHGGD